MPGHRRLRRSPSGRCRLGRRRNARVARGSSSSTRWPASVPPGTSTPTPTSQDWITSTLPYRAVRDGVGSDQRREDHPGEQPEPDQSGRGGHRPWQQRMPWDAPAEEQPLQPPNEHHGAQHRQHAADRGLAPAILRHTRIHTNPAAAVQRHHPDGADPHCAGRRCCRPGSGSGGGAGHASTRPGLGQRVGRRPERRHRTAR